MHINKKTIVLPGTLVVMTTNRNKDEREVAQVDGQVSASKTQENADESVNISVEGTNKQRKEMSEGKSELPPHLENLKQRIKELKEEIEELKQKIKTIQNDSNFSEQSKQEQLKGLYMQMASLQGALKDTSDGLTDALKVMGIDDPSVLLRML